MSDDTPVTLSQEGGRQLTPEMWAAVQEELHDFLEEGKVTITPGGALPKENPGPFSRKRKKRPNLPGTHMLVDGTADVLVQVEQTLQRANIPGLRVGRSKHRSSDHVAHRITNMSLAVADTASETAHKMSSDQPVTLSQEGGRQLTPEMWAAVQEELRDLLEGGQIIIEKGGLDPYSRKRKKQPKGVPGRIEGTHMRVYGTADVLDQVEQTLQRANITALRVGRAKFLQSGLRVRKDRSKRRNNPVTT